MAKTITLTRRCGFFWGGDDSLLDEDSAVLESIGIDFIYNLQEFIFHYLDNKKYATNATKSTTSNLHGICNYCIRMCHISASVDCMKYMKHIQHTYVVCDIQYDNPLYN